MNVISIASISIFYNSNHDFEFVTLREHKVIGLYLKYGSMDLVAIDIDVTRERVRKIIHRFLAKCIVYGESPILLPSTKALSLEIDNVKKLDYLNGR